jgi:hypothetical protein
VWQHENTGTLIPLPQLILRAEMLQQNRHFKKGQRPPTLTSTQIGTSKILFRERGNPEEKSQKEMNLFATE